MNFAEWSRQKREAEKSDNTVKNQRSIADMSFAEWSRQKREAEKSDNTVKNQRSITGMSFAEWSKKRRTEGTSPLDAAKVEAGYEKTFGISKRRAEAVRESEREKREKLLTYDLEAGQSELEKLSDDVSRIDELTRKISDADKWLSDYEEKSRLNTDYRFRTKSRYDSLTKSRGEYQSELDELLETYDGANLDELTERLRTSRQYHSDAKKYQKIEQMTSEAVNAQDYRAYSEKGASIENPRMTSDDGGILDMLGLNYFVGENGIEKADWSNRYSLMTDDERAVHNYYLAKYGEGKANEYLDAINDELEARRGTAAAKTHDDSAMELAVSWASGIEQFNQGVSGAFNALTGNEEGTDNSSLGYMHGTMAQNNKWLWKTANDLLSTTGNMAPSIITSMIPIVGPSASTAVMGASAGGNAYNEMIDLGYGADQARAYGLLIGASEAGLQRMLGGISTLGGGNAAKVAASKLDRIFAAIAVKAPKLIQNAAKTAAKVGASMGSEAVEEGLQSLLEPLFKSAVTHDVYSPDFEEVMYSALLGALSAGALEGVPTAISDAQLYKVEKLIEDKIVSAKAAADGTIPQVESIVEGLDDTVLTRDMSEGAVEQLKKGVSEIGEEHAGEWAVDFREAYHAGRLGTSMPDGKGSTSQMTDGQRAAIYKLGEADAKAESAADRTPQSAKASASDGDSDADLLGDAEISEAISDMVEDDKLGARKAAPSGMTGMRVLKNTEISAEEMRVRRSKAAQAKTDTARTGHLTGAKESDIRLAETLSEVFGRKIVFDSSDYEINGKFEDGTVYVNPDGSDLFETVVMHELTHSVKGTKAYKKLVRNLQEYYDGANGEGAWNVLIADMWTKYQKTYEAKQGRSFTDADAEYEAAASVISGFFTKTDWADGQAVSLDAFVEQNRTAAARMWYTLKRVATRLKEDISEGVKARVKGGNYDSAAREKKLALRKIEDMRDMLGRALRQAKKARGSDGRSKNNAEFTLGELSLTNERAPINSASNVSISQNGGSVKSNYSIPDESYGTAAKTKAEEVNRTKALRLLEGGTDPQEVYEKTGWFYDNAGKFVVDHEAPVYNKSSRRVESERLAKENDELRQKAGKLSAGYTPVKKQARSIIGEVCDMLGGGYTKKQLSEYTDKMLSISDRYSAVDSNGVHAVPFSEISDDIAALAADMQEARLENTENAETAKLLKAELKSPLYLSENARSDFSEGYGTVARKYRGRVNLTSKGKGVPVDVRYMELSETYPEWFSTDIVSEADQLRRIMEVSDIVYSQDFVTDGRYDFSGGEAVMEADASKVMARIIEGLGEIEAMPKTDADRYAREAEKARRETEAVRAEMGEQISREVEKARAEERRRADEELEWESFHNRRRADQMEADYREGLKRADDTIDQIAHSYSVATEQMEADYRETLERQTEQAARSYQKERIKRLYNRLKKLLDHPTKNRNIKEGEREMVDEALRLMESIFAEKITPQDMLELDFAYATETELKNLEHLQGLYDKLAELEAKVNAERADRNGILEYDSSDAHLKENIRQVADMESVCDIDAGKLQKSGKRPTDIFSEYFNSWGNVLYSDELGEISLKNSSVKSEVRHGITAEKIASIEAIPDVLKNGKIIFSETKPDSDVKRVVVCAPINIGSKPYYMGVMLQRDSQNQRLYLHNVAIIKETSELTQADLLTTGALASDEHLFITSILQNALAVKYQNINNHIKKEELEAVKIEIKKYENRLSELFGRKRSEIQSMKVSGLMSRFAAEYGKLRDAEEGYISDAYDPAVHDRINRLASDKSVSGKTVRQLSSAELEELYEVFAIAVNVVYRSNNLFADLKSANVNAAMTSVIGELSNTDASRFTGKAQFIEKHFKWGNMMPIYALRQIGSETLTRLYKNLRTGEDTWARDIDEAIEFFGRTAERYKYNEWNKDRDKVFTFHTQSGQAFELTLDQIMSVYAFSKREQASEHLSDGGIVIKKDADKLFGRVKHKAKKAAAESEASEILRDIVGEATAYKLTPEVMSKIVGTLTADQKGFADQMQSYLSDVMAAKGNEVSMKLYGIKLFKEQHYYPLKSADVYLRAQLDAANQDVKIKNKGMTRETVKGANNPIVIDGFMDVWAGHVNDMSLYHGLTLPMEDFTKVYGYTGRTSADSDAVSVRAAIKNLWGSAATDYIDGLIRDVNGGVRQDSSGAFDSLVSRTKKAAVLASLSVIVQQPTAVIRAMAYIDPKFFVGLPKPTPKAHTATWSELKKYCPIAIIKEMGRFDTGTGRGTVDYIVGDKTVRDKVDDVMGFFAAKADELAWCNIWKACKREAAEKTPSLKNDNKALCEAAAERFTEVVTMTQVYDSVFSRSANMRSKNGLDKMATAFMPEPTTTVNMLADAYTQAKRGDKKLWKRDVPAVVTSSLVNSIFVSIVYAMRDDDEDETMLEKYVSALTSSVMQSANPLTYIPYLRDLWSVIEGYDVERSDMSLISDLAEALENCSKDSVSVLEKVTGVVGAVCNIFPGIPVKNIARDAYGIFNFINKSFINTDPVTKLGTYQAFENALKAPFTRIPVVNNFVAADTKSSVLYQAAMSDSAHLERMRAGYKTEEAFETALEKAIRENDERITEAAKRFADGDEIYRISVIEEIAREGHFDGELVEGAIRSAVSSYNTQIRNAAEASNAGEKSEYKKAVKKLVDAGYDKASVESAVTAEAKAIAADEDATTLRAVGSDIANTYYTTGDVGAALDAGDTSAAKRIIKEIVNAKTASGTKVSAARSTIKSALTRYYSERFLSASNSERVRIRRALYATGLYGSVDEVISLTNGWIIESKKK